jgi:NAD(P)-dependent dehydrogenase (short-subunit alcohol dehydrogenase family)
MMLDLKDKKVVVIGGGNSIGGAIAEAVAQEEADVVIWLRKWNSDGNEAKVLPVTQLEIPSQRLNGASPHKSLWRESMGRHKSYW